jgi:hypothetical protein
MFGLNPREENKKNVLPLSERVPPCLYALRRVSRTEAFRVVSDIKTSFIEIPDASRKTQN